MHKFYIFLSIVVLSIVASLGRIDLSSAIESSLVISQIKLGDEVSARNEFVELYNNSPVDVDITDWCVYYESLSLTSKKLACFMTDNSSIRAILPSGSFALLVSKEQSQLEGNMTGDLTFSATLAGNGGYVYLANDRNEEIDKVGWNADRTAGDFAPAPGSSSAISRKLALDSDLFQDTQINADDFEIAPLRDLYIYGEVLEIIDVCVNLDGVQSELPENYYIDELKGCYEVVDLCPNIEDIQLIVADGFDIDVNGDCQMDVCPNIDGIQAILPAKTGLSDDGDCVPIDACLNLEGIQTNIPETHYLSESGKCMLNIVKLKLNEILPNVDGVDDGREFIELYNPNDFEVSLTNYIFKLDSNSSKFYEFPNEAKIMANDYFAVYSFSPEFSLKNTAGEVLLYTSDNQLIDKVSYEKPDEDESWSLVDDVWQYTNQVTSGVANKKYFRPEKEVIVAQEVELVPCGPNQYRNPETNRCKNIEIAPLALAPCKDGQYRSEETNRCRNIVDTISVPVPCKEGQYRSEETNRCRNIVTDVVALLPCDEGEERNPATNRCRKIAVASVLSGSTLAPCAEGEERNPETNRCRKVIKEIPVADYSVEPVASNNDNSTLLWSIVGVGSIALIYGVWEWRSEIALFFRKIKNLLRLGR